MKAPVPPNEPERLAALRAYRILDTGAEQVYDDITKLAAFICDAPISIISLVDDTRQWFKSKVGLTLDQTPRDVAFCAHAILQTEPLIVKDALADQRFCDSSLVTGEPHIRFYAGFPLVTSEGFALGTLCAMDRKTRELSPHQRQTMLALSRQVMALLEHRRILFQLAQALEQVKVLSGLLPMCAWCKRIRDDHGYWKSVEVYLKEHTEADFTHGICPECLAKAIPAGKKS
jgi:GAF domain-containing protein